MRTQAYRQPIEVEMTGKVAWKLVFYYDNTICDIPMSLNHTRIRSTSINLGIFNNALTSGANKTFAASGQVCSDEAYECCGPPSVLNEVSISNVHGLSKALEEALVGVSGTRSSADTQMETRLYDIASGDMLSLYQLYFIAPGFSHDFDVYSTDLDGKDKSEAVRFSVPASSIRFISGITIYYNVLQPPTDRVSEDISVRSDGGTKVMEPDDNLNSSYPRGSAWLVPAYTYKRSEAATGLHLSSKPSYELQMEGIKIDVLARGAPPPNQDVPFIMSACQKDSQFKIRDVALLRSDNNEELRWDPQSRYDGLTPNINGDFRKGKPVHLAWKLCYTGL
ncbi:hypothetical protein EIP86_006489 [Pleurotus ostreatoroseus]|nr:hypothetical protein EIP86_006489 [Pleurotus ostreatoroseus]